MPKLSITALMCLSALLMLASSTHAAGSAKTRRTCVTDEEIATARRNIAKYGWAKDKLKSLKDDVIRSSWCEVGKTADQLLEVPDEQFWDLMPDTRIHREYYVNQHKGCPVHGIAIKKFSVFHPWKIDPFNKPFKIQCPVGEEWYPSNDFANGDLTSGDFPDDGTGFKKDGDTYYFVGEYIHAVYLNAVRPALDRLSQLYLFTGDRRYAHKAAVILLRLAEQFPNSTDKKDRCYKYPYAVRSGLITDYIWSCSDVAGIAAGYDRIYDALDDPDTVAFVSKKIPAIKTGADIRFYVEENVVRVGAKALQDVAIVGNFGMHQNSAATLALVMDDVKGTNKPDSLDLIEWLYYKADGPLRTFARNSLFKDGGGAESIGYNTSKLAMFPTLNKVEALRKLHPREIDAARYPVLWDEPKLRAMTGNYFMDLVTLDRYYPGVGDGTPEPMHPGDRARGLKCLLGGYQETVYRQYGDERIATTLMDAKGKITHYSIFDKPIDAEVRRAVKKLGTFLPRETQMFDGYRLAIARSGSEEDQRALWVFYGAHPAHIHRDPLNLGFQALGKALLPDLGYPKSWDFAATWETHIATHNTVMIDKTNPTIHDFGRLISLQSANGVEMIDSQEDPYRTSDLAFGEGGDRLYRRTSLMIDLSPQDCYMADIFRVRGGKEHWQSWHGPAVQPVYEGPALVQQPKGTLAGEDVEFNTKRPGPDGKPFLDYQAMFTNVRRGAATEAYSLDYDCGGERKVHVRITGLPDPGTELVLADGRAPSQPDDYTAYYSFACRKGDAPLTSQYLTVIEPYSDKRVVDRIERLSPEGKAIPGYRPAGIRVIAKEIEDTILSTGIPDGAAKLGDGTAFRGDVGLIRRKSGRIERLFLSSGTRLLTGDASISLARAENIGRMTALNRGANEITVAMEIGDPKALIGRRIRIESPERCDAYEVIAADAAGPGEVRLTLNTTSLLAEGVAVDCDDGVIKNKTMLDFAALGMTDGKWRQTYSLYRGAVIENEAGTASLRILGARGRSEPEDVRYDVVLDEMSKRTADELKSLFTDSDGDARAIFRLYEYGVGDRVVVPGLASLHATGDGCYALEATDDVTLSLPCSAGARLLMRCAGSSEWTEIARSSANSICATLPLARFGGRTHLRIEN